MAFAFAHLTGRTLSMFQLQNLAPSAVALMHLLLGVALLGLFASTVFTLLAIVATLRFRFNRVRTESNADFLPPLSLFKPVHGDEPGLEAHLESFFLQDYPSYEILFCARSEHDPGLLTARRVADRHPNVPVRFLSTGEPRYINAKVASLEVMEAAAAHDIFVISDSDVHVAPDYLRAVARPFRNKKVGALTCLYRGEARPGLWGQLEAIGMSIEMTSGVLVANMLEGMRFLLGPTMAVRRECVRAIGGFGVFGDYCSDDFILGKLVAANGYSIVLSQHVIDHVIVNEGFLDTQKHQIRWMRSTRFSRPKGHFGTSLTFSMPFGVLALLAALPLHHPTIGLSLFLYAVAIRMLLAAVVGGFAVRERILLRTVLLYPFRDLLGFFYWAASYWSDLILWRGREFRLTQDGLMIPATDPVGEEKHAVSAGV